MPTILAGPLVDEMTLDGLCADEGETFSSGTADDVVATLVPELAVLP
jgi:hypothetical protein